MVRKFQESVKGVQWVVSHPSTICNKSADANFSRVRASERSALLSLQQTTQNKSRLLTLQQSRRWCLCTGKTGGVFIFLSDLGKQSSFRFCFFFSFGYCICHGQRCTKSCWRPHLAKENTAMQEEEGRTMLGLGPGVSLTWHCFSKSLSRQVWEKVGGLGSFQLLDS